MPHRVTAVGEQTSLADWKLRAGQRLLIGFAGPAVDDDLRLLVKEIQPAGFVLFKRNVVEPAQVYELNRELASLVNPHHPALLAVDQEGGRVQRVRAPATEWPPMRQVGRTDLAGQVSEALAIELRAMGFNLNFAPVADVDSNPDNPVIGDRSFGATVERVCEQVAAFVQAHQDAGIIACAKHFPGHGDTDTDSHLALPRVDRSLDSLKQTELPPFAAAVRAGVATVMSAHVVFPPLDDVPATLSSTIIPRLLRTGMGFDGVVFSDDMEMKAVYGRYGTEEQVWKATEATVDVMLCCESPELQHEMFRELVRAQESSETQARAAVDAVKRVNALRERFFLGQPPPPGLEVVGQASHRGLADQVRDRAG